MCECSCRGVCPPDWPAVARTEAADSKLVCALPLGCGRRGMRPSIGGRCCQCAPSRGKGISPLKNGGIIKAGLDAAFAGCTGKSGGKLRGNVSAWLVSCPLDKALGAAALLAFVTRLCFPAFSREVVRILALVLGACGTALLIGATTFALAACWTECCTGLGMSSDPEGIPFLRMLLLPSATATGARGAALGPSSSTMLASIAENEPASASWVRKASGGAVELVTADMAALCAGMYGAMCAAAAAATAVYRTLGSSS